MCVTCCDFQMGCPIVRYQQLVRMTSLTPPPVDTLHLAGGQILYRLMPLCNTFPNLVTEQDLDLSPRPDAEYCSPSREYAQRMYANIPPLFHPIQLTPIFILITISLNQTHLCRIALPHLQTVLSALSTNSTSVYPGLRTVLAKIGGYRLATVTDNLRLRLFDIAYHFRLLGPPVASGTGSKRCCI